MKELNLEDYPLCPAWLGQGLWGLLARIQVPPQPPASGH